MSQAELQRFTTAMLNDPGLAERYVAAGSVAELAALLRRDGYDIADAEIEAARRRSTEMTDEELDGITGGGFVFGLAGITLVGGLVIGGVIAANSIHSLATGQENPVTDALRDFASRLYPQ
ncbi:Nif11-like leader peptide family natural product precursor [Azospirillum halopraeferens]|uniref:Nif11-like leader peptide family natural product precursor n=1 Tax=Azospirillum halopraeferens TaxID=34010 RepID=UPI000410692F|nr:Nif11-like leader peptide family natural product precursor [Azospirillum halopraeferens]